MAYGGSLTFNPLRDSIPLPDGSSFRFSPPVGPELPSNGYVSTTEYYSAPPADGASVKLAVSPTSERIQLVEPFRAWDGEDSMDLSVLIKVKGKCSKLDCSLSSTPDIPS